MSLLFYVLGFWPQGVWDLSLPTRDQTHTPLGGRVKSSPLDHQGNSSFQKSYIPHHTCFSFFFFNSESGNCGVGLATKLCPTLATAWTVAHQILCARDPPGKNAGVGCPFLPQGIFPTQRLNPGPWGLVLCKQILNHLSHQQTPKHLKTFKVIRPQRNSIQTDSLFTHHL